MKTLVNGLGARYGDRDVLDSITFVLNPGEIVGLVGPNGHGKTTLMKRMLDLVPGTGSATFDGLPYRSLATPQRYVGALLGTEAFHPRRSALNHLRTVGAVAGITHQQAQNVLNRVGLADYARATPASFSMGMKQRLGLAGALMFEPELLILDEPTNGLDMDGAIWLRSSLKSLAQDGRTVLLSTHILDELERVADRVLILHTGKLRADCTMDEIRTLNLKPAVVVTAERAHELALALRCDHDATVTEEGDTLVITGLTASEVGALAHRLGHAIHGLGTTKPTLEESYASIVGAGSRAEPKERAA